MPEPNPIWGLHVAPGAIAGALVRRVGDVYEVRDAFTVGAPTDTDGLVAATDQALSGSGVSGRASLTAVPDHDLVVGTGTIPSDELYLNDEEVYHHLHDFAPFEPGEGQLAYRSIGARDERKYLVAAISPRAQAALDAMAIRLDESLHGIGLATPSLVRGARALGFIDGRTFLVDIQAQQTVVIAVDGDDERRYLVGSGLERCAASMDATELLAADLHRILAYHAQVARRDPPASHERGAADVVLVGANATRARELLNRSLGDRLAPSGHRAGKAERITDASGSALAAEFAHTYVGAIGAALEGLAAPESRFVLRHPPLDVAESHADAGLPATTPARQAAEAKAVGGGRRAVIVLVGIIALVALTIAMWVALAPGDNPGVSEQPVVESGSTGNPPPEEAPIDAEREAARARTALGDLALNIAHARGIAAAAAALSSAAPAHLARSYDVENVRGTLRFTLLAEVDAGITPEVRRAVRAAVEATPGIQQVGIDIRDGALRVRYRTIISARPTPGTGPRRAYLGGFAAEGDPELARSVPLDADGRPVISREQARELSAAAHARVEPVLLCENELEFMRTMLTESEALAAVLPPPTPSTAGDDAAGGRDADGER